VTLSRLLRVATKLCLIRKENHQRSLHVTDDGYIVFPYPLLSCFLSTTTKPQSSNVMMIRVWVQCSSAFFLLLCFPCLSYDEGSRPLSKVLDLRFPVSSSYDFFAIE
jgi:hypothetical protein